MIFQSEHKQMCKWGFWKFILELKESLDSKSLRLSGKTKYGFKYKLTFYL